MGVSCFAGGGGGSGSSLSEQAAAAMQLQGLKQQQQQQMQMESLQYQLLINELSRKNRDLEFKLSEMESQFLTLQLENQRIRADNQKMSMRLRFSYPWNQPTDPRKTQPPSPPKQEW